MKSNLLGVELVGLTDEDLAGHKKMIVALNAGALALIDQAKEHYGFDLDRSAIVCRQIGEVGQGEVDIEFTDPTTKQVYGLGVDGSTWGAG